MARPKPPLYSWTREQLIDWANDLSRRIVCGTVTWAPGAVPANSTTSTTLTSATAPQLDGLRSTHSVSFTPPDTITAGISVDTVTVPASNQLRVVLRNHTGSPINLPSSDWQLKAWMV